VWPKKTPRPERSIFNLVNGVSPSEWSSVDFDLVPWPADPSLTIATVQYSLGMRGGEAGAELARDLDGLVAGHAPDAPQETAQFLAIDVLHGNVRGAVHFADVVYAADVGMRDLARNPDLAVETFEQPGIAGGGFREKLQGYRLVELEIDGAIDLAHAASADQTENAVAIGQDRSGVKAPFFGRA
jgi:hypothetical protein